MDLIGMIDTGLAAVERMLTPYREKPPEEARHSRGVGERLFVISASAVRSEEEPGVVECLLVGLDGKAWEFQLGPIAAAYFSRTLDDAAQAIPGWAGRRP